MNHAWGTSALVLRDARRRSGLTQVEMAALAGVNQSVVSAYETGHRQPALSTLATLVEATGFELEVRLRRPPRRLRHLTGPVGRRVVRHRAELIEVAARYGIQNVRVFGSVARGQDRPDSDVDLLVDLPAGMGLFTLGQVRNELEAILGADVDLVPAKDVKDDIRARVEREQVTL